MSPVMPTTAASSDPPVVLVDLKEGAAAAGEKEVVATNKLKNPRAAFCAMVLVVRLSSVPLIPSRFISTCMFS
jgi:hypothetical protein